jgi:hypothetical protein
MLVPHQDEKILGFFETWMMSVPGDGVAPLPGAPGRKRETLFSVSGCQATGCSPQELEVPREAVAEGIRIGQIDVVQLLPSPRWVSSPGAGPPRRASSPRVVGLARGRAHHLVHQMQLARGLVGRDPRAAVRGQRVERRRRELRGCTTAATRWPQRSSGTPTTTASNTSGWLFKAASTSSG